jgi:hypothetical protein
MDNLVYTPGGDCAEEDCGNDKGDNSEGTPQPTWHSSGIIGTVPEADHYGRAISVRYICIETI